MRKSAFVFAVVAGLAGWEWIAAVGAATRTADRLQWDEPAKTYTAKAGDVAAHFVFMVKNVSGGDLTIDRVMSSCDCTVAKPPRDPWRMKPGDADKLDVLVDLRNKTPGTFFKDVDVLSGGETNVLTVSVTIPADVTNGMSPAMADRLFGQQLAGVDHQAVFKGNICVKCHLVPAFGKSGENLFHVACGICHEASHRATMVPDLHALKTEIDTNYWQNWVAHGKAGTLMPGFAATDGGPLDDEQIKGLVNYLTNAFPRPLKLPAATPAKN
jgi:cytochrome c553